MDIFDNLERYGELRRSHGGGGRTLL